VTTRVFQNKKLCGGPAVVLCWVTVWVKQTTFQKSYLKKKSFRNAREWKLRIWDPKQKTKLARERDTSPPPCPLHARALTGDRARMRGAEKRADAPIHLINRSQELKAGKYLRLFSSSQKKKNHRENWGKGKRNFCILYLKKRIFFSIPLHFLARAFARISARI